MSKIGKNIQKIRKVKKLSQTAFSELFGLSRTSVGAYEEGRAEPKTDTLIQIAKYFGLSIDSLLTKTIAVNDLYKFSKYDDKYLTGAKSVGDSGKCFVVLEEAKTHYIEHIGEGEFLLGLPTFSLSFLELNNKRIFQAGLEYLVCTPKVSDTDGCYLLITLDGMLEVESLPTDDSKILEIWEVKARILMSTIEVVSDDARITNLEREVLEIKRLMNN